MAYEELFNIFYGRAYLGLEPSPDQITRARQVVWRMSNDEWHEWIEYRQFRLDSIRSHATR